MLAWPAWWSNTVPDEPFDDLDLTALAAWVFRCRLQVQPPADRSAGRAALHADARP